MLQNIFLKHIYERRWSTLIWCASIIGFTLLTVGIFHSLSSSSFSQALKNIPQSLQGLVGTASSYASIDGYLNQQVFVKSMPIMTIVFGVLVFTGILAGEEENGTLQVLLTEPISRTRILLEKFVSAVVLSFMVCFSVFIGCVIGVWLIHEPAHYGKILLAIIALWLITIAFGSIGFMLAAITGKRGLSGSVAGSFGFVSYMITSLAVGVKLLAHIDTFSPMHYFDPSTHSIFTAGIQATDVLVLFAIVVICFLVAVFAFNKRDIYMR